MDEIIICKDCLKFFDDNNRLRKEIRLKKKEILNLKHQIKALDLTPYCDCGERMSKGASKEQHDDYEVKRFYSWVCLTCKKESLKKKIELDTKIN